MECDSVLLFHFVMLQMLLSTSMVIHTKVRQCRSGNVAFDK